MSQKINTNKFLKNVRIGLWRIEVEEGKLPRFYADEVMDELLGITEEITPEERFAFHRRCVHPDDMEMFLEYSDKLTETQTEIVYRYIHPISGEMFVRCAGIRDNSVTSGISIIGTHQDISETIRVEKEKEAERRLAELNNELRQEAERNENYYRDLLDMQSCGVMAYTLPGHRVIHMNAKALQTYGFKSVEEAQQRLGAVLRKVYYPQTDTIKHLKKLRNEDDMVDYECVIGKGESNECHALAKTKVVVIPSGERAVITTFLDVSDMITLRKALKQAEEGSRAKSSFLFAMSHDLRTPMNAIIGYTALMEKHWGEKEVTAGYLQKLKEAGNFLMDLIGNILEVARIESGKETLTETAWNLCNLEDTLDLLLDRDIYKKQLTLKKNMELQHPKVYCDVLKIQEITMNLLSNAVKYTPEGGTIHFTIRELPYEREGYALFQTVVEDTGIGISKEYIPHLFEAFSREKSSSESGIIGTGLGLRIVKKFVDLMEGSIVVESEIGEGTRFTVTIPHRIATANEYISEENAKELPEEIKLNNVRILLAEDNMLNAEIAMTLLADANAYVELAPDGEKALSMLKRATDGYYDLIIMDIQMPHMNGYEATKNIRGLPDGRCRIPIIAMTANAFEEDRKRAIESGMNGYVTKPIKIEELISTIKKILKS
jgi:signal transduction histidine kinase/CheY-like chemotaxis protein